MWSSFVVCHELSHPTSFSCQTKVRIIVFKMTPFFVGTEENCHATRTFVSRLPYIFLSEHHAVRISAWQTTLYTKAWRDFSQCLLWRHQKVTMLNIGSLVPEDRLFATLLFKESRNSSSKLFHKIVHKGRDWDFWNLPLLVYPSVVTSFVRHKKRKKNTKKQQQQKVQEPWRERTGRAMWPTFRNSTSLWIVRDTQSAITWRKHNVDNCGCHRCRKSQ